MPQIFFEYQSIVDQLSAGGDSGRTAHTVSKTVREGLLNSRLGILR
ncbi:uncharacterized protein METZ01_LOCUS474628 [marine metagenome]|uniref:Uncharacterized protein n=1 Tax=marine metagenome TaxID=408172 RepID=A0A383BPD6_9ZZZZ